MADEKIKAGVGGRQWGCFYFKEDHESAAKHVRATRPEVFDWILEHPEGLPDGSPMLPLLLKTAMEILPKASLVDLGNVALILRMEADPASEAEKLLLELKARQGQEWRERHSMPRRDN